MKLLSIGAFMLLLASATSLVSGNQSKQFIQEIWSRASDVLPESTMNRVGPMIPAYTERVFLLMPLQVREKFGGKVWNALELMILRLLLAWHLVPAFSMVALIGFAEGQWARASKKGLVKIHSPMRFSLALGGLATIPILILLWVTAPLVVAINVLMSCVFVLAILSLRNLIVHAPTQF